MCRIREDNSIENVMMPVSSLVLVRLLQETIVVQGLQLNVAHIILSWILITEYIYIYISNIINQTISF